MRRYDERAIGRGMLLSRYLRVAGRRTGHRPGRSASSNAGPKPASRHHLRPHDEVGLFALHWAWVELSKAAMSGQAIDDAYILRRDLNASFGLEVSGDA
jgi:hypothetical protein